MENNSTQTGVKPRAKDIARIFMQYPGHTIEAHHSDPKHTGKLMGVHYQHLYVEIEGSRAQYGIGISAASSLTLHLKPLSKISEEEAVIIAKLQFPGYDGRHGGKVNRFVKLAHGFELHTADDILYVSINRLYANAQQQLIEWGYAVPWGKWSVEELVGFGIFKLTE